MSWIERGGKTICMAAFWRLRINWIWYVHWRGKRKKRTNGTFYQYVCKGSCKEYGRNRRLILTGGNWVKRTEAYQKEFQEIHDLFVPEEYSKKLKLGEEYVLGYIANLVLYGQTAKENGGKKMSKFTNKIDFAVITVNANPMAILWMEIVPEQIWMDSVRYQMYVLTSEKSETVFRIWKIFRTDWWQMWTVVKAWVKEPE